jgi:HEAT repeat protein
VGIVESSPWTVSHRRAVGYLLARLGDDAGPALDRLAASSDESVRAIGADALQLHTLIVQLSAADPLRREAALQELTRLVESHPEIINHAVELFATAYTRNEERRRDVRIVAVRGLARCGKPAAAALVKSLENPDPFFYQYTRAALVAMRPGGRDEMLRGLEHRDPLVRQRLIYILVDVGLDNEIAAAIEPLVNDRDDVVRKAATRALATYRARLSRE